MSTTFERFFENIYKFDVEKNHSFSRAVRLLASIRFNKLEGNDEETLVILHEYTYYQITNPNISLDYL